MGNGKKRTLTTVVIMIIIAITIVVLYFYCTNRTDPLNENSTEELSDVEKLLNKDLEQSYPETPREVMKLYGNMLKTLYSDLSDEEVDALAKKIRELYDSEFLENNPEAEYIKNLYSEISEWKESDRRIANLILVNEELEKENEVDGQKYADVYVSFTIEEQGKFSEVWRFLLRLSEDEKWKILGWEYVPEEEE